MRPHRRTETAAAADPPPAALEPSAPPELLLVCEAWSSSLTDGRWRFSIETTAGAPVLEAADEEPGDLNRLTLLAAVRGLEAIDGPASVILLSTNRYLIRSLADSLPRWRVNDFAWEHFGRVIDIQHADLWRRIDRAVRIHRVEACLVSSRLVSSGRIGATEQWNLKDPKSSGGESSTFRIDRPHAGVAPPQTARTPADGLRRLLLGFPASTEASPAEAAGRVMPEGRRRGSGRHRFTSADLMEAP